MRPNRHLDQRVARKVCRLRHHRREGRVELGRIHASMMPWFQSFSNPNPHFGSCAPAATPGTLDRCFKNAFASAGVSVGCRPSSSAITPVMKGVAMLVPAFTRKPAATIDDAICGGIDALDRHDTIIAPGAVTSGLNIPSRRGPGLLKSEIVSNVRPTARAVPVESIHWLRLVNEATVTT